jgi:ABC-type glycerol-3-phosphate transport system permease component
MKKRIIGAELTAVHLVLVLVSLFWVYPFIWMVSASFKSQAELFADRLGLIPASLTPDNFVRAWKLARFDAYFLNSIAVTVSCVIIVLMTSAMAGYAVGRYEFRGKKAVLSVLVASMAIPLGFSIIPIYQLLKGLGLTNTRIGLILAESGGSNIIFILLFSGFFAQIPKELEEAAIIDAANFPTIFTKVALPLSQPVVGSVVIMQSIWTWNSFLLPLVLTLSNQRLRTLAVGLYALKGEHSVDWTGIAAGGTISLLPIMILFIFLQKYFVEGLAGSVKG